MLKSTLHVVKVTPLDGFIVATLFPVDVDSKIVLLGSSCLIIEVKPTNIQGF